jgi:U3 small nucleolar RNA-associated protein 3
MAKRRKAPRATGVATRPQDADRFNPEETFNDSEDEFFAGRDKVLLDEEPAAKRRRKLEEQERNLQASDEEVYQDRDEESEDEDEARNAVEEEEEDETHWGTSKADYYNADVIETEADALEEEQEARRLQQKQLQSMTEADFGFDESAWADDSQAEKRPTVERLPELQIPEDATNDERLKILKSRYPEFEPLTKDFLALQSTYQILKKEAELEQPNDGPTLKFRALSAYLGSVAMYLSLLTSSKNGLSMPPGELREHPIMANLMSCRQLWQEVESLRSIEIQSEEKHTRDKLPASLEEIVPAPTPAKKAKKAKKEKKRSSPSPSPEFASPVPETASTKRKREKRPKRNDLQELLDASLKIPVEAESDFGDEAPLTHEEAEEKARRKRSLRFYTSQIAQKANKRGEASRQAGGDDDVPYKERIRDKQERLMREAEQRARSDATKDEALGADDEGSVDGQKINDEANEYYDMLVSNSKQKKAGKRAKAEAFAEAARQGAQVYEQEQVGPDGKRKITYAIEKNKGLQPKRKKDVRNPRVKKRKKFDEKMKKLGSMRPVYKGGEGKGGYGGEATGIKKNVVKSIKL